MLLFERESRGENFVPIGTFAAEVRRWTMFHAYECLTGPLAEKLAPALLNESFSSIWKGIVDAHFAKLGKVNLKILKTLICIELSSAVPPFYF